MRRKEEEEEEKGRRQREVTRTLTEQDGWMD